MKRLSLPALSLMALCFVASTAAASTDVNVSINGFLPAPPGVHVYVEAGRPYYRDNGRVVYLKRDEGYRGKKRHHGRRGHDWEHGGRGHGHGHHGRHD